jgi:hypothetical protein
MFYKDPGIYLPLPISAPTCRHPQTLASIIRIHVQDNLLHSSERRKLIIVRINYN